MFGMIFHMTFGVMAIPHTLYPNYAPRSSVHIHHMSIVPQYCKHKKICVRRRRRNERLRVMYCTICPLFGIILFVPRHPTTTYEFFSCTSFPSHTTQLAVHCNPPPPMEKTIALATSFNNNVSIPSSFDGSALVHIISGIVI